MWLLRNLIFVFYFSLMQISATGTQAVTYLEGNALQTPYRVQYTQG